MLTAVQWGLYLVQMLLIGAAGIAALSTLQAGFGFTATRAVGLEIVWLLAICLVTDAQEKRGRTRGSWLHLAYSALVGFSIWPVLRGLQLYFDISKERAFGLFTGSSPSAWHPHGACARSVAPSGG